MRCDHRCLFVLNIQAFSPNLKYVISVGEQHDMVVNVWDWKSGSKHGTGKISAKVTGLAFSEDGSRFVTVGNRSVRFWYMAIKSKVQYGQIPFVRNLLLKIHNYIFDTQSMVSYRSFCVFKAKLTSQDQILNR